MMTNQAETTAQAFTAGTWQPLVLFAGPREPWNGNGRGDENEGNDVASDPSTSHPGLAAVLLVFALALSRADKSVRRLGPLRIRWKRDWRKG